MWKFFLETLRDLIQVMMVLSIFLEELGKWKGVTVFNSDRSTFKEGGKNGNGSWKEKNFYTVYEKRNVPRTLEKII